MREPRQVLKEFGTTIPTDIKVRVCDSTADCRYLVLPMIPDKAKTLVDNFKADRNCRQEVIEELAALVTRDSMIGVTILS